MGNTFKSKKRRHPLQHLTKPTGLYQECKWEQTKIEQNIYNGVIAPICPGLEDESPKRTECPICFLFFPQFALNATCCCDHKVCTECLLQIKNPVPPSICPFCNNKNLKFKIIVNAISDPERYGLSVNQFDAYVKQIQKNKQQQTQGKSDGTSPSVVVATHKERLEHEAEMSKLNHQAELERHTSPILSAFNSNTSSRMPSYSLDGGTARSSLSSSHRQNRRRNSDRRNRSSRSSRNYLASREQRELVQNTFGIPSELTNLMSQQNLDEILLAEAMRRSMSESVSEQQSSSQENPKNEEQQEAGKKKCATSSAFDNMIIGSNITDPKSEDEMLAAAIALSLKEKKNSSSTDDDGNNNNDNNDNNNNNNNNKKKKKQNKAVVLKKQPAEEGNNDDNNDVESIKSNADSLKALSSNAEESRQLVKAGEIVNDDNNDEGKRVSTEEMSTIMKQEVGDDEIALEFSKTESMKSGKVENDDTINVVDGDTIVNNNNIKLERVRSDDLEEEALQKAIKDSMKLSEAEYNKNGNTTEVAYGFEVNYDISDDEIFNTNEHSTASSTDEIEDDKNMEETHNGNNINDNGEKNDHIASSIENTINMELDNIINQVVSLHVENKC